MKTTATMKYSKNTTIVVDLGNPKNPPPLRPSLATIARVKEHAVIVRDRQS